MCLEELHRSVANHSDGEADGCSAVQELLDVGLQLEIAECGLDIQFTVSAMSRWCSNQACG
jgi:hypothetical protein